MVKRRRDVQKNQTYSIDRETRQMKSCAGLEGAEQEEACSDQAENRTYTVRDAVGNIFAERVSRRVVISFAFVFHEEYGTRPVRRLLLSKAEGFRE